MPWKFNEHAYDMCVHELKMNDPNNAKFDFTKDECMKIYQINITKLNKMLDELKERLVEKTEKYRKHNELEKKDRPQKLHEITDWIDKVETLLKRFNEAHQHITMPEQIIAAKPFINSQSSVSTPSTISHEPIGHHFMLKPVTPAMSATPVSSELSTNQNFSLVEVPDTKKLVLQEKQEKTKCCCCF
jgi:hypothetical protein